MAVKQEPRQAIILFRVLAKLKGVGACKDEKKHKDYTTLVRTGKSHMELYKLSGR